MATLPIFEDDQSSPSQKPKQVIFLKGAHAGSGKSRSIFNRAMEGKPTIIATPTDGLSEQYAAYFAAQGVHYVLISRKHNPDYSSSQHLKDSVKAKAPLIFVNQGVLHRTEVDTSAYEIFEDEICDIVQTFSFNKAQYLRETLSKIIDVETTVSTDYYRLTLTQAAIDIAANGWDYDGIKENEMLLELAECTASRGNPPAK